MEAGSQDTDACHATETTVMQPRPATHASSQSKVNLLGQTRLI